MAPPTQTSRILQNAFCFLPKEDGEEKDSVRGRVRPDHRRSNSALPSIYSSYKTDRRTRSGRRQQEQNGGEQQQAEKTLPTDQTAPRSSFGLLGDQLQSVSRRFANSISFLHSGSRREEPHNPTCWPTTDDGHRDSDGDGGITVEAIAVPDKERLQPPSFIKHINKQSSDVDGEGKDDLGTPVDPVAVGKKKPSTSSSLMKLITRRTDEKPQLFDGVRSSLTRSRSSGSSLWFTEADEKACALMLAPVPVADNYEVPGDPGIKPQEEQKQPHKNLSLGFHETSSEREEYCPWPECTALQIKLDSQQETFLGDGIQRHKAAPKVNEEEEDVYLQGKRSTSEVGLLHDNNTLMILPEEIDKPEQDEEIEGGQPFDFWHGTSLKSGSGSTDYTGLQVTPDLQPKTLSLICHNTPITTQENGKDREYRDIESDGEGGPPFRFYLTSLNDDHGIEGGEEEGWDRWTHGSWSPSPRRTTPDSHDQGRVPEVDIPSSLEDTEVTCCLAEVVDNMQLGAEQKPQAGLADFALNAGSRRRKVQFTSRDDDGLTNFEGVAQHPDLSETLLGKLVATKHHQVRYLQDELEQTRAQLADLELDCEAQKDLKLAFKVQAVRLGLALKKLREFTLENGLDPRGVERKSPAGVSANARPKEVGQASDTEHTTKEINSSPKLDLLKAEAKRFGWLCDPKEVELREYIGSGSSAEIFKALWHNLEVAVKCVQPSSFGGNTEEAIAAFCQEVEILSRQRHPYILHMFAACLSPPDRAWIVTEYLSSGTLTEWLHGTKSREKNRIAPLPPVSERLRIALEISIAMQYLHRLTPKVIHRDLKPSNILLDENKHVRIADFNCARRFTNEVAILTGETGTYVYMAPEVVCHEFYDHMCDIYSFAVILCELVTGNPPYIDTNYSPAEIACKVAQGTLRPTLPENRPTALLQLIRSAWEQDPRKRPSFSEITAKLNIIAKDYNGVEEPSRDPLAKTLFYQ